MTAWLTIVAALVTDADGRALLVRKRGTDAFLQPGGKVEPGEQPMDALIRELDEELGLVVDAAGLSYLGRFEAPAANEADTWVRADVWALETDAPVSPQAELDELIWIAHPHEAHARVIAPLSTQYLLPIWQERMQPSSLS